MSKTFIKTLWLTAIGLVCACYVQPLRAANAGDAEITLQNRPQSIAELISAIEKRASVQFVFDVEQIDLHRKVTVTPGKRTVRAFLTEAFVGGDPAVVYLDKYIVLASAKAAGTSRSNAGRHISGHVTDEKGEPLVGANVVITGSTRGASTDLNGAFSLVLLPNSSVLEISYLGMQTKAISLLTSQEKFEIRLTHDNNVLEELVVIGYGTQVKRDLTGAITSISSKDMDRAVAGNLESSLQGKIPGVNIVSNSGEPGAGNTITVRGASSVNGSSEPLYIIDGIPMESGNIVSIQGDATFSPIAGINPADIESIEVLRDAASAAIYGSRAANGVVIITTKGGNELKVQRPTITFNHTSSIARVERYIDVLNGEQFRQIYTEARRNAGFSINNDWITNPTHPYYMHSTNWQELLFRSTYQTKNDLNMRGSSDKMSYGLSFGYRNTAPIVIGTSYRQYNARANFTYRLSRRLTGATKVSYGYINYNRVISGQSNMSSLLRTIISTPPIFSPYAPDGSLPDRLGKNEFRNPLALAKKYPIEFGRNQTTAFQSFKLDIVKGLVLRVNLSMERNETVQESYFPKEYDSNHIDVLRWRQDISTKLLNENTLSYTHRFGQHTLDVMAGQSMQTVSGKSLNMVGRNFIDSSLTVIQNASTISTVRQDISDYAMLSFFGRANYNYKSRYLATLTMRCDGSSRFGKNNRFGYFPSASVGWRFSDEPFMLFARNVLDDAKLRASIGVTGNQNIGNYTWRGIFTANSSNYNGQTAIINTELANRDLNWEQTIQYNVGLDLSLFHGRVALTADAYIKETNNLLFSNPVPGYTGFTSRYENFGSIRNRGLEFLLRTVNIDRCDWRWTLNFNISFNRNQITELPNHEPVIFSQNGVYAIAREGSPMGAFYGWRAKGVYASSTDNIWKDPVTGIVRPILKGTVEGQAFSGGDMIWDDINNDGLINDDDRVVIGDPNPDFTGGFGTDLSWRGLSLNIFFTYSYGNDMINNQRRIRNKMGQVMNLGHDVLARWQKEGDRAAYPMIAYSDPMDNFRCSSFVVEDGSYLRLKELTISYALPKTLCAKLRTQSIILSFSAGNLLTWSRYSGYDPEVNTSLIPLISGLDDGAFPKNRTYSFGVNLTF